MNPTVREAKLNGYSVTVWCTYSCRRGVPVDLLALEVADKGDWPLSRVFRVMRCERCKGPADALLVDRQVVGRLERVAEYRRPRNDGR